MSPLSPAYDNKIVRKYSARTIEHKMENKTALQEEIGWIAEPKQPIVCISTGMTDALGGPLLEQLLEGLLELPIGLLIRGRGSNKYGDMFTKLAKGASYKMKIVADTDIGLRKMLAASDIALFLSPTQDPNAVEDALRYGVIPVAPAMAKLENYNPVQETGNAFLYDKVTKWQCFATLVRALETFKFPYDWRTIQRHAMESAQTEEANAE
ncbi:MAG: hypothetical protein KBD00_04815 [Candidatus Peribacteraceae bacterium]|nr:hypothetical protein [Candidatus Peribacteraceae bacterium]